MIKEKYDKIIPNIGGTKFTAYYTRGKNMKLSDGVTVINIWKPMTKEYSYRSDQVYKDAVIEISGNGTNTFTYKQYKLIDKIVEVAIDYLNAERENIIDREKDATLEPVKRETIEPTKTTKAIRYDELEIGGIYEDEKHKQWVFLGKGTLYKDGIRYNRSNDGISYSDYIYMPYEENSIENAGNNYYNLLQGFSNPDSYASKKRFFKMVGSLNVNNNDSIVINDRGFTEYIVVPGMNPKMAFAQYQENNSGGIRR